MKDIAAAMRRRWRALAPALAALLFLVATASCIEDSVSTSPAQQPAFSTDTLRMGIVFTEATTNTYSMRVYNRYDKVMNISRIAFRDNEAGIFRANVDGRSGTEFADVEIRPNDSIYVFVDARPAANGAWTPERVEATLDFVTNGVTASVVIAADGVDVERIHGLTIMSDTVWRGDRLRQVFDSLIVAPGARLTLEEGTRLMFHDKALMRVDGTLVSLGTPQAPVEMSGDRTGNVVADISFDLMSGQWEGLRFGASSHSSSMSHTIVRNTLEGTCVDSLAGSSQPGVPALTLLNCRLRNSAGYALEVRHADVEATGCEIADASMGVMRLEGGSHRFAYCTFANYYLFTALGGPALQLSHLFADDIIPGNAAPLMEARFDNCIIYGNGGDMAPGDLQGSAVVVSRCLLKSAGEDDANFRNCIWDTDPLYFTVREEYVFDYRLREGSPAIGAADATVRAPADFYGMERGSEPDLGAYVSER